MRSFAFKLILVLLLPIPVAAQWIGRDGKRLAETESMKSAGNFGVQIVLTPDDKAFRNAWNASATPPTLQSTGKVSRGASISAMIVFHGCAPAQNGKCNAAVTFTLVSPDGKQMPAGSGPLWNDAAPQGRLLLSNASITIGFDSTDPAGAYRVVATVMDGVSGSRIQVSAPFALQ